MVPELSSANLKDALQAGYRVATDILRHIAELPVAVIPRILAAFIDWRLCDACVMDSRGFRSATSGFFLLPRWAARCARNHTIPTTDVPLTLTSPRESGGDSILSEFHGSAPCFGISSRTCSHFAHLYAAGGRDVTGRGKSGISCLAGLPRGMMRPRCLSSPWDILSRQRSGFRIPLPRAFRSTNHGHA